MRAIKREIVVITGASAGVGRATVRRFARDGAHIGLVARGVNGLEAARREVEAAGGRALVLPTDVADPKQVEAAAETVEQQFGPIGIWINDAMTSVFAPLKDTTPEEFRRVTEVTYLGAVHGTMSALKRKLPRDRGTIVPCKSAPHWRTEAFPCNPPITVPSMPSTVSPIHCAANSFTTKAACMSRWCNCPA